MELDKEEFKHYLKEKAKETPWGEIGYITFKRTYARRLKENDTSSNTEEFWQVVEREIDACGRQLDLDFTELEKYRYAETRLALKWSVAGRFMWQLGTKTVDKLGLPSLQNCAACVINEPIKPFIWAFEMLMLGSGVGYNIQRHNIFQLPKLKNKIKIERIDSNDADFIVPDTREGWVKLLGKILKAHFYSGEGFTYSTKCIRGKGSPIKGFGGTASGPEDLCNGMKEIDKVLNNRSNKKLRPIDCLDIMNIIGSIVVAGNVRRSAQLAIGDYDDIEFLKAKRWDLGQIPNWRSMSNNSVAAPEDMSDLPKEFWDTYEQGEPYGLINLELSRECGRIGETQYKDLNVEAYNPCQPDFATLLTKEGIKSFKEININDEIWSKEGWTKILNKWSTGIKPVYSYNTLSGGVFIGTENHKVDTPEGKIEIKNAKSILIFSENDEEKYSIVTNIEYLGEFEVFDISVNNESHTYWTGGLSVSNCAEQSLHNYETCCLAEIFLPNIDSYEELLEILTYAYRVNKHSLNLHCSLKETEAIVNKNMRMGIGMTGILQATEEQRSWLKNAYSWLRNYDKEYSLKNGFPESIKLTTVKPSGTLSLLAGLTPGVHPNPAGPYYIRRIRISSASPLIEICRNYGYHIEYQKNFDGSDDKSTMVVSFPCEIPESTPVAANFSWKEQVEMVMRMQREWSDNSVSCTIYYKKEDLPEIKEYLNSHFRNEIKTISFLLYHGHGFVQAPYETISKEEYLKMKERVRPIISIQAVEDEFELSECESGSCPVR